MAEVKANLPVTSVTITLSEVEASRLRALLQQTVVWGEGPIGALAEEIELSLAALDITASPVLLQYSATYNMFVEG